MCDIFLREKVTVGTLLAPLCSVTVALVNNKPTNWLIQIEISVDCPGKEQVVEKMEQVEKRTGVEENPISNS